MSNAKKILVAGATGQQGGAVARALLARGHTVRGMTRTPDSAAARDLAGRGVEAVRADFDDRASLVDATRGVDAVFAMSSFWETGVSDEERQGKALVDAAATAHVGHYVLSSVASAHRHTGVPHFESKFRIEQHLERAQIASTIIRPVYFMENATTYGAQDLAERKLAVALPPDRPLQQIAVDDIGSFAALVIENREEFRGHAIDIAGDEVTGVEAATAISAAAGVDVEYAEIPIAALRATSEELAAMYEFFDKVGMNADIDALARDYPEVGWHRYADWVAQQDWAQLVGPASLITQP